MAVSISDSYSLYTPVGPWCVATV